MSDFRVTRRKAPPGLEPLSSAEIEERETENGVRQFDRMLEIMEEAIASSIPFQLQPSTILELQRLAVDGLQPDAGQFRKEEMEIEGSFHVPPRAREVPGLVERLCHYINSGRGSPIHQCAYALWRLNWIHPFSDGNGRTSRILGYMMLNIRLGFILPGETTIPELIAGDKAPYYKALSAADTAERAGRPFDVSEMEGLVERLLERQLATIADPASTQDAQSD